MNRKVLNELINLKEERRKLMAECECDINEYTFSKVERNHISKHRHDKQACLTLEILDVMIKEDEATFVES